MWLNDNIGIGLQGDYLIMPYKHIANSWQGSIRLMWRIGGKSLKVKPEIQYVEKIIEKVNRKTYNHETNCRNSKPAQCFM